jgi:hypothetical protein
MKPFLWLTVFIVFGVYLLFGQAVNGQRITQTLTIAAGTPIRLATSVTLADRIVVEMKHGGSGLGYVMDGIPNGTTPSTTSNNPIELAPATSTAPGGIYADSSAIGIDISQIWIDGANSGDKVLVSYYRRTF